MRSWAKFPAYLALSNAIEIKRQNGDRGREAGAKEKGGSSRAKG